VCADLPSFKTLLAQTPHEALAAFEADVRGSRLTRQRIWLHLQACLPFNFH